MTGDGLAARPHPEVASFFDPATHTITHVVSDPATGACAVIDSVLDYDAKSGATGTGSADAVIAHIKEHDLTVVWILETHVHADHLTAAPYLKERLGGRTGIGAHIADVQDTWNSVFNYKEGMQTEPELFDHLFEDGETFDIGSMRAEVLYTPGHTNVDVTYLIGDAAFVGDTLFMPDYGTARADFPGGDARRLYRSIHKLLDLPEETRLYLCHDYLPEGRSDFRWQTTVGKEKANIHVSGVAEDDFVAMRQARDKTLATPALLYPSLQVNIRAGETPPEEDNGVSYIKIPIKRPRSSGQG